MKASLIAALLAALTSTSAAQDGTVFNADTLQADSTPNAISMETLKEPKMAQREGGVADGVFDVDRYEAAGPADCVDGKAGEYSCNKVDLLGFLRHQDAGIRTCEGNDILGPCLNEPYVVSF